MKQPTHPPRGGAGRLLAALLALSALGGCGGQGDGDDGGAPAEGGPDGGPAVDGGPECEAGAARPCLRPDGSCTWGAQRCTPEGRWGACEGPYERREELCNGLDDDCDGLTDERFLELGTPCGRGACEGGVLRCAPDGLGLLCSTMPGGPEDLSGPERCNGLDDDCDGLTDEEAAEQRSWFRDADGDGYGAGEVALRACERPEGHAAVAGDCDDTDPAVHPMAGDWPGDGVDGDCDGMDCLAVLEGEVYFAVCPAALGWSDARAACQEAGYQDLASIRSPLEQRALTALVAQVGRSAWIGFHDQEEEGTWRWSDGAPVTVVHWAPGEPNDFGRDEDCGTMWVPQGWWADEPCHSTTVTPAFVCEARSEGDVDHDGDGFTAEDGDCNDLDGSVHPGAPEQCDGVDDDCDGEVDEGAEALRTWYPDADGDGYGSPVGAVSGGCLPPEGFVHDDSDCDDTDPSVHPFAGDVIGDEVDGDCDGMDCLGRLVGDAYFVMCPKEGGPDWAAPTWLQAQATCIGGGYDGLASIRSAEEQQAVVTMRNEVDRDLLPWIGYHDRRVEGTWEWVDGSGPWYAAWAPGEPNDAEGREDCAHIGVDGAWNDLACDTRLAAWLCSRHPRMGADDDGDGMTVEQGDCNDFNPRIYAGAPDPPGDGLDSDCEGDGDGV